MGKNEGGGSPEEGIYGKRTTREMDEWKNGIQALDLWSWPYGISRANQNAPV